MHLSIVTMTEKVFEGEASSLSVPTASGMITILDHHETLVSMVLPGEIQMVVDGAKRSLFTGGGFMHIENNTVTFLADSTEDMGALTEQAAEEARVRAEQEVSSAVGEDALVFARAELGRSLAKLKVVRRRAGSRRGGDVETSL